MNVCSAISIYLKSSVTNARIDMNRVLDILDFNYFQRILENKSNITIELENCSENKLIYLSFGDLFSDCWIPLFPLNIENAYTFSANVFCCCSWIVVNFIFIIEKKIALCAKATDIWQSNICSTEY